MNCASSMSAKKHWIECSFKIRLCEQLNPPVPIFDISKCEKKSYTEIYNQHTG